MKINANFKVFAGVHFDPSQYIASPSYGVNRFMLDRIGSEKARATTIVEYQPNSKFPQHTHIGGEEFLVLSGTFKDQFGSFPQGTYVRNPIGSQHEPWVDDDGCTILVKLLQMADTGEGIQPLHVNVNLDKETKGVTTKFGSVLKLYQNDQTGEIVEMCWIKPDTVFSLGVGPKTNDDEEEEDIGGEELFVLDGSLVVATTTTTTTSTSGDDNDDKNNNKEEEYQKWGWLRFPPTAAGSSSSSNIRASLKAGNTGAQVYRKRGHLTEKAMKMEKIQITED